MKRLISCILVVALLLVSCGEKNTKKIESISSILEKQTTESIKETENNSEVVDVIDSNIYTEEYVKELGIKSVTEEKLLNYVEDSIYSKVVSDLNNEEYYVENVEAIYISKEYLDELEYNSKENLYFGYKLSEIEKEFGDEKYVFTLGEDGHTIVQKVEEDENDSNFAKIAKNIAIGSGVILVCITVSAVTAPTLPAVSMIFAYSAIDATKYAFSSAAAAGITTCVMDGLQGKNMKESLEEAALNASEGFKVGAIIGAFKGGIGEFSALRGAAAEGSLTMNDAAKIQMKTKYPLDIIKQLKNLEQGEFLKKIGLKTKMVNGKLALVRDIDWNYVDEDGLTNLQRAMKGLAPLDPNGDPYELHHIGQKMDSTLAILTKEEHRGKGNFKLLHDLLKDSEIDREVFKEIREEFWKSMAAMV